jgi:hypothetical protein
MFLRESVWQTGVRNEADHPPSEISYQALSCSAPAIEHIRLAPPWLPPVLPPTLAHGQKKKTRLCEKHTIGTMKVVWATGSSGQDARRM